LLFPVTSNVEQMGTTESKELPDRVLDQLEAESYFDKPELLQ
jgi:hypothetical protein